MANYSSRSILSSSIQINTLIAEYFSKMTFDDFLQSSIFMLKKATSKFALILMFLFGLFMIFFGFFAIANTNNSGGFGFLIMLFCFAFALFCVG